MSEFKPISLIPGFEVFTKHEMDINGILRREGREFKWHSDKDGYLRCELSMNGYRKKILQHRAIALLYIPNPDNKPLVDHENGDPVDNRVENLRWCTVAENIRNRRFRCKPKSGHKNVRKKHTQVGTWYWSVVVQVNGKEFSKHFPCGEADTEPTAEIIAHRDQMLKEHHGEFACL